MIPLPQKKYQIIYADPPWEYKQSGSETNSRGLAKQHYSTMPTEDICNLPDGVSDDIFNDLVNALDKAIMLIYDMSIRKVAFPGDMIRRWENLVKYARAKESEVEEG